MRITPSVVVTLALLGSTTALTPSKKTKGLNKLSAASVADIKVLEEQYARQDAEDSKERRVVYESVVVPPIEVPVPDIDFSKISSLLSPPEAYQAMAAKGAYNAKASAGKTVFSAALGGVYVGMGAMLSLAVAGNSPDLAAADPGLYKFLFGALFPMNLLLTLQCGGQLYTGNTANMMAAVCEGKADFKALARSWGLSWIGNFIGCTMFAVACKYAGVLEGGAGQLAAATLVTKTSYGLGQTFVKAVFCNWLVCLAVYLSTQAKDMGGKYLAIWLPVSCFVSIGFEHSVANMFLLPAGLMSTHDVSVQTALFHNLIPVTIGNAVSGSLFVGAGLSFMYGKLGENDGKVAILGLLNRLIEAVDTEEEVKALKAEISKLESVSTTLESTTELQIEASKDSVEKPQTLKLETVAQATETPLESHSTKAKEAAATIVAVSVSNELSHQAAPSVIATEATPEIMQKQTLDVQPLQAQSMPLTEEVAELSLEATADEAESAASWQEMPDGNVMQAVHVEAAELPAQNTSESPAAEPLASATVNVRTEAPATNSAPRYPRIEQSYMPDDFFGDRVKNGLLP